jgi:hypothetical protein
VTTPTRVTYAEYKARPKPRYFGHFANSGLQPAGKETIFATANRASRRAAMKPTHRHGPNVRTSPRPAPWAQYPMRTSKILRAVTWYQRQIEGAA